MSPDNFQVIIFVTICVLDLVKFGKLLVFILSGSEKDEMSIISYSVAVGR